MNEAGDTNATYFRLPPKGLKKLEFYFRRLKSFIFIKIDIPF